MIYMFIYFLMSYELTWYSNNWNVCRDLYIECTTMCLFCIYQLVLSMYSTYVALYSGTHGMCMLYAHAGVITLVLSLVLSHAGVITRTNPHQSAQSKIDAGVSILV